MNFETTFTQSLPLTLSSRGQLVLNYLKQHPNIVSWEEQVQMIYKEDVIENSIYIWFSLMDDEAEIKQYLSGTTLYEFTVCQSYNRM